MSEPADLSVSQPHRSRGVPILLASLAAIGAAKAAAWFYFRSRQPAMDEQTRDRLQPPGRA